MKMNTHRIALTLSLLLVLLCSNAHAQLFGGQMIPRKANNQGTIASIDCIGATTTGTLTHGVAASGVSTNISYTGGDSGAYSAQTINSNGVTGLVASLPAGIFANGSGTLTYSITGTPSASGTASFALSIGGQSCTLNVFVDTCSLPLQPSLIAGVDTACEGSLQTYSIVGQSGVSYTWAVPSNWSILSGQGTDTITVSAGNTGGNISVTPNNVCGSGITRTKAVNSMMPPAQPSAISGIGNPTPGSIESYSVNNVSGVNYTWAVPTGWIILSGQGTHSITVSVGNSNGSITVIPSIVF